MQEDSCSQDLKGGTPTRTSTPTQALIGVIHVARKRVETRKTPPKVLVMNLVFETELEGPVHKKSH